MTPAERAFTIKRALLRVLSDCLGYAVLEQAVRDAAELKIDHLKPTVAEFDAQLRTIETERLAVVVNCERGRKYKLTDTGTAWLAENA